MSVARLVVIGGVAGGMSCAARARRLNEAAAITVVERGPFVSFANCGLPYHIGGEIADRSKLILRTPEAMKKTLNIDVCVLTEAVSIDRAAKKVRLRDLASGKEEDIAYDALVLSTGAEPLRPPIPGIDREGIFTLRNIPDMDRILSWIKEKDAKRAVVVGGGYIGLEVAEQLQHRGMKVAVAEALPQLMQPLDPEMAIVLQQEMESHGIEIHTSDGVDRFEGDGPIRVVLKSGCVLEGDLVVLGMGVRPDIGMARAAGIETGPLGGLKVDLSMRTNDPAIYAVGDAVEVRCGVTGEPALIPLAGPANRQGRLVADNIFGKPGTYKGTWGTAGIRLYGLTGACTGVTEKRLRKLGIPYTAVHVHHAQHVGYYPGAKAMALKLIFSPEDGRIFGAQAVGPEDVPRRIDVIAAAMMAGMTVEDLAQVEMCYAPPFGAAKDAVNMAGMAAENIRAGLVATAYLEDIVNFDPATQAIIDVRNKPELEADGTIPGSIHIPLGELRSRLGDVPRGKRLIVHCASGQRSYNASRILMQNGFTDVVNLSGSMKTWKPLLPTAEPATAR